MNCTVETARHVGTDIRSFAAIHCSGIFDLIYNDEGLLKKVTTVVRPLPHSWSD
jgi:hypothetical protein